MWFSFETNVFLKHWNVLCALRQRPKRINFTPA
jgi:hypothetical protein